MANTEKKVLISDGRFHIHNNYEDLEVNSGELLTKPDLTLSVVELLDRYTHGRPLPDNMVRNNNYGAMTPINKKGFELADVPALKRQLEQDIAKNTAELEKLKKLKVEQDAEKVKAKEEAQYKQFKERLNNENSQKLTKDDSKESQK